MNPELETSSEAHKTGHRWVDLSVAGCALLVSFCSLGLAVHHGKTMERLVTANSMPFLQITSSSGEYASDGSVRQVMSFDLRNSGVGPARVEWLTRTLDDKPIEDWDAMMKALHAEAVSSGGVDSAIAVGRKSTSDVPTFLSGGGSLQSMRWQRTDENAPFWDSVNKVRSGSRLRLQACYCSIFDECWIADSQIFEPKQVDRC
jgi:hypothetical protein